MANVCPAGGEHERLNRQDEIGFQGKWIEMVMTLKGKNGDWIQEWTPCKKCGAIYLLSESIVLLTIEHK